LGVIYIINIKNIFNWFGWKSKLFLVLLVNIVIFYFGIKTGFDLKKETNFTNIPNSCFVDSLIWASKCNFYLNTHTEVWNNIYCYTFHYKDDPTFQFGHAITAFEYKDTLWIYDPNWGTMPIDAKGNRLEYNKKIKSYLTSIYNIIVLEDFMVDDWSYIQRIKQKKMNENQTQVSKYLDEPKKE